MSLRREVFIALLQRKTLIETKNCTLKCLKQHYSNLAVNNFSLTAKFLSVYSKETQIWQLTIFP